MARKTDVSTVRVKLNHMCYVTGCEGRIGDVIDVTPDKAKWLLSVGGGSLVDPRDLDMEPTNEPTGNSGAGSDKPE